MIELHLMMCNTNFGLLMHITFKAVNLLEVSRIISYEYYFEQKRIACDRPRFKANINR